MIERWALDYGFASSNKTWTCIEPRGLENLTKKLRRTPELGCVVTGSVAAEILAPYAPPRLAMLYVRDADKAMQALGLRETESGANVVLAETAYDVAFQRTSTPDGFEIAAPSQVAVDLMSGPGRNPSEALAVMDWMQRNERNWRR